MSCEDCGSTKRLSTVIRFTICKECKSKSKYSLITKSTVKTKYFLSDDDLENIDYDEKKNPHYSSASPMKLYLEKDVKRYFLKKHNIKIKDLKLKLSELEQIKIDKATKIKDSKNIKKQKREEELKKELEKSGVELRKDSGLCNGFINGTIKDWTCDEIAQRMCEMKYLHEYCDFSRFYNMAWELKRDADFYDRIREPTFDLAEELALKEVGPYPKIFPWQG